MDSFELDLLPFEGGAYNPKHFSVFSRKDKEWKQYTELVRKHKIIASNPYNTMLVGHKIPMVIYVNTDE